MAHIQLRMNSLGIGVEQCNGCDRFFSRGERMNAVADEDNEPLGWFCDACIEDWKQHGAESRVAKKAAA